MKKVLALLTTSLLPTIAFALTQSDTKIPKTLSKGPKDIVNLIVVIGDWMFTILLALAVVFLVTAAYIYLTSGGGEKVAKAHKMLIYSVVAVAVAVLSKGIVNVILYTVAGDALQNQTINQELQR